MSLNVAYMLMLKVTLFCVFGVMQCLRVLRFKKHIILHMHTVVAPLWLTFLKHVDLYKAHCSEKRGVRWLASYPVH